jgi:APA family basic amino acid/polyamine antiporter
MLTTCFNAAHRQVGVLGSDTVVLVTQPVGAVDSVARGVVSTVGAGLFLGLAPAAALAGWWLVAGMVLAAALAVLFALSTPDSTAGSMAPLVGILGRIAATAAVAAAFGRYVLPGRPEVGAVLLVVVVTAVALLAPPLPPGVDRVAAVVVVGVLLVIAVACFTIAPMDLPTAPPADAAGADQPLGLLPSAVLLYLCFTGSPAASRRDRIVVVGLVLAVSLVVAVGVLWQLGGERLALSRAPLLDTLTAADASGVDGMLAVGVTVACVFALRGVLGDVRDLAPVTRLRGHQLVALAAAVAALCVLLLDPEYTLASAAVLLLGEAVIRMLTARWNRA